MKNWKQAVHDGAVSGASASIVSTLALAASGQRENGSIFAPTNAISHWLWGNRAARQNAPTARYTATGYLIHHASATFWAVLYEKWFGKQAVEKPLPVLGKAAVMAGVACFVDYQMTPQRLHPGYEMRLSKTALFAVYAAFGLGLALPALLRSAGQQLPAT